MAGRKRPGLFGIECIRIQKEIGGIINIKEIFMNGEKIELKYEPDKDEKKMLILRSQKTQMKIR